MCAALANDAFKRCVRSSKWSEEFLTRTLELRRDAREIFDHALRAVDAHRAVLRAVRLDGLRLEILDSRFDLRTHPKIYSVALGKAAGAMAAALNETLGDRLAGGVVSTSAGDLRLPARWHTFAGGHPTPNAASFDAARAAFELLRRADEDSTIIIFLVSGGGSAQMEWPRDERVARDDLVEANRVLVSCGAKIAEINAVRRRISAVKAGGLSAIAPRTAQVTLIVSDTNKGDEANVASGPTMPMSKDQIDADEVIARYDLAARLPLSVRRAVEESSKERLISPTHHRHYVLLDNEHAVSSAVEPARARGYKVETAPDVNEQSIDEGCAMLLARLLKIRRDAREGNPVCLISGGEFACPVRDSGEGGRNSETVLRLAIEMDKLRQTTNDNSLSLVAFSAGTDGIDGNSPAAGAMADSLTLARARFLNLDAQKFLDGSDAYSFFASLGDAVVTGATGTNVRDLRILLAS